jgi:hypothetical protein
MPNLQSAPMTRLTFEHIPHACGGALEFWRHGFVWVMTYGRIPANRNRDGKFRECHASGEKQNRPQCVFIAKDIHDGVRLYGEEWARWPVALWARRDAWLVKASEHSCAQAERDDGCHWLWGTGRRALTLFVFFPTCKLRHAQLCSPVIVSPLKSSSRLTPWLPSLPYLTLNSSIDIETTHPPHIHTS